MFCVLDSQAPPRHPRLRVRTAHKTTTLRAARYAGRVRSLEQSVSATEPPVADAVRDPLASPETMLAARRRTMSERLELALSWNAVAAELRMGLAAVTGHTHSPSR